MILKELYIRDDRHSNTEFCQCPKLRTYALYLTDMELCRVCRKLGLMTGFVQCVRSLSCPPATLYPPSRKQTFVLLALHPCISHHLVLAVSPLFSALWRIMFCCALLIYYLLCIYRSFLGPDNMCLYIRGAAAFLADTSLSRLLLNAAIKCVHKR